MVACYNENCTKPPLSWRNVKHYNKEKLPLLGFIHLSIACNHCEKAPCLRACPSGAYSKDTQTNAIIHSPELCIGCKYCTWACPFDAPQYNPETRIIEKCNFCNNRLKNNEIPACALNCPTGALSYGDIEHTESPQVFGLSEKPIYPRIKVLGSNIKDSIPISSNYLEGKTGIQQNISTESTLKVYAERIIGEWPLAIFTFIGSILTGWMGAGLFKNSVPLSIWLFIALAAFGMLLSTLHLGKPLRAPFSVRNFKTSWLSREILLFGVFAVFGFFSVLFNYIVIDVLAVIFGSLFLIAVEMVYSITQKLYKTPIHSANTILTALTFTLLFSQSWSLLLAILVIKALLFIIRNGTLPAGPSFIIVLISFFRLLAGFILPFGMIAFAQVTVFWVLVTLIILGELIDRLLFYGDFKPERPFDRINSK